MIYELHRPCGFEEIYEKYYDRVYKYAFTLLLNKENAEDVTSETFLAAYANFGSYDETRASVATWLTRIAHNRAVNLMRSAEYTRRTVSLRVSTFLSSFEITLSQSHWST